MTYLIALRSSRGDFISYRVSTLSLALLFLWFLSFIFTFISLEDNSEILYFTSEFYNPRSEEILLWNDKNININWPIPPVIISKKDKIDKTLKEIKPI